MACKKHFRHYKCIKFKCIQLKCISRNSALMHCKHSRLASEFHTEVSILPELQQHHKKSSSVGIGTVNKHIQLTSMTVGYTVR